MGNTDSQASIPGTRDSNFMLPRKPKSCSLRFRPAKQKVLSPHSWWRGREGGSGYKSRVLGRGGVSQHKTSRPYIPQQYDYFTMGSNAKDIGKLPETIYPHPYYEFGEQNCFVGEGSGHSQARNGIPGETSPWELVENRCSPRVLVRKDGSLRVDFSGTDGLAPDRSGRPVHLLKFSPYKTVPDHVRTSTDPTLRASKGSSLSSDGSWYDSSWGIVGEVSDVEKFSLVQTFDSGNRVNINSSHLTEDSPTRACTNSSNFTEESHTTVNTKSLTLLEQGCTGDSNSFSVKEEKDTRVNTNSFSITEENYARNKTSCTFMEDCCPRDSTNSSGYSEDYNIKDSLALQGRQGAYTQGSSPVFFADLYRDPRMAVTFPAARDLHPTFLDINPNHSHASCASVLDETAEQECLGVKEYASYTLPCQKSIPVTDTNARKSFLKSRIRRISDWTGSLSRKKRKLQEPRSNDSECLDSGVDMQTAEDSSLSQTLNPLWYTAVPQPPSLSCSAITMPACRGNGGSDDTDCAALQQDVYETFMCKLEMVHDSSEPELTEETAETSSDSGGSLEQLDMLLEKEQGVVRKAGCLSFKPLITLNKDRKLELVSRRKWKQYWVTLKGCTLLFYETLGKNPTDQDAPPHYALFAEDSIVQAVPEHPKKENVFCLSNSYGDVYLFQAASQTDLENWATAVHSASASLLAKRHGKEDTVRLLCSQKRSLLQKIDMDGKLKKMAELQLSVISDHKNRKAIVSQIQQWEQNLEKFNVDLFRMRCYLASLQGSELPNPKILLAAASRPSKMALSRLGMFSVSSFHALVCSRNEATLRRRSHSVSQGMPSRRGLFSSLKGLDTLARCRRDKRQSVSQTLESYTGGQLGHISPGSFEKLDGLANLHSVAPPDGSQWNSGLERQTCVYFGDGQAIKVTIKRDHTAADMLSFTCKMKHLDPHKHCLRVWTGAGQDTLLSTPAPNDPLWDLPYDKLEVFPLNVYTLCMTRPTSTADFGFAVTGHVDGSGNSHMFVSEVLQHGLAFTEGLRAGDEILVLNGMSVSTLDLGQMQTLFGQQKLNLVIKREDTIAEEQASSWPDLYPKDPCSLVPPLNQSRTLGKFLHEHQSTDVSSVPDIPRFEEDSMEPCPVEAAYKSTDTVITAFSGVQEGSKDMTENLSDPQPGLLHPPCPRHMSATERLQKVVQELVDTEKSYVKDLTCLFEIYLKPLQTQTFLSLDEMESLFGSLPEMLDFQRVFLQTLQEHIASSPDFSTLAPPGQFKKLLLSLGGSFLYYADHFKLYSGFCANHIKVQKVLERAKTDQTFKDFLEARNPAKQHSSTLESYLIKPVQRVLKYPLLLRELVSLTDADSEEHSHLTEALKAMEKVASHINEMQKLYEEYGTVFDHLVAEQSGSEKQITEISMGEFLMHSSAVWLNPFPSLGRMRKDPELTIFIFKKAVILVCRENSKVKKKMGTTRSTYSHGDLDPFKFRWLIPLSVLQVRLASTAGSEANCVWELVHTKSEVEGRPETTFQLCSSVQESKASAVKVIRSLLREYVRRTTLVDRASELRSASVTSSTRPPNSRTGSTQMSWLCKRDCSVGESLPAHQKSHLLSEQHLLNLDGGPQETAIPGENDSSCGEAHGDSLTRAMEAHFQRLWITEVAPVSKSATSEHSKGVERDTPVRQTNPVTKTPETETKNRRLSLDDAPSMDLNALLERDFSVQSLTSVLNEDCFYDKDEGKTPIPTI